MSKEQQVLEDYQDKLLRKKFGHEEESDDDDELLELLEDESEFDQYREQRLQELSREFKNSKRNIEEGHGSVETLLNEEQALQRTTKTKFTVLHFFHPNFDKCKIMDSKLDVLAQRHLGVKFLRINVEDAPFLVTRLKVKVLPVLILYINGVEANRLVGFEKLNYSKSGDFKVEALEEFLLNNGLIERKANRFQRITEKANNEDDDYESDLDL